MTNAGSSIFGNHQEGTLPAGAVGLRGLLLCGLVAVLINDFLLGPAAAQHAAGVRPD